MKSIDKIAEVTWYDACHKSYDDSMLEAIKHTDNGRELLVTNTSYGKIAKLTKYVVVLITEESNSADKEVTVIPRGWVRKIRYLK